MDCDSTQTFKQEESRIATLLIIKSFKILGAYKYHQTFFEFDGHFTALFFNYIDFEIGFNLS